MKVKTEVRQNELRDRQVSVRQTLRISKNGVRVKGLDINEEQIWTYDELEVQKRLKFWRGRSVKILRSIVL